LEYVVEITAERRGALYAPRIEPVSSSDFHRGQWIGFEIDASREGQASPDPEALTDTVRYLRA